jgi:hypothetical protein
MPNNIEIRIYIYKIKNIDILFNNKPTFDV